jgi:simple sugar transport system permease protein
VLSVLVALAVGAIIILAFGFDPVEGYKGLLRYAFVGRGNLTVTVLNAVPLVFTGLAVAFAFRCGLFNIGAEGQLLVGSLAAGWLGLHLGLPGPIAVPVLLLTGMLAGGLWALLPGVLKATTGAHEVITTMMMSWIGLYLTSYLIKNVLRDPRSSLPASPVIDEANWLPKLDKVFPFLFERPTRLHAGLFIALATVLIIWYLLTRTTLGFEIRAVGANPFAAQVGGASVSRSVVIALVVSGMLAGLAGTVEILALHHRVFDRFSAGYGFTGITVALLARNHPLGVIPSALLFGALTNGGAGMQLQADIPVDIVDVLSGTIIFLVGAEELGRALGRRRARRQAARAVGLATTEAIERREREGG